MSVNPQDVKKRWAVIRSKRECDLSLDPESVARYLSRRESELVRERILESLTQLAQYRVREGFISHDPKDKGDLATCEGLEAFLTPAVEGALPFSEFLRQYPADERAEFIAAIKRDIKELLGHWENGEFSAKPYADAFKIRKAIRANLEKEFKRVDVTEAAAMACRVLIHLLTLKLNRTDEDLFQQEIGKELEEARLFEALEKAIDFLLRAFQKGNGQLDGEDEETKIANATYKKSPGSGWSWTIWPTLPPMLFFTAAAVDAFAELDLYLIRPVIAKELVTPEAQKLADFYEKNLANLDKFQLCVEMARRWVQEVVLPELSKDYGQYAETFPDEKDSDAVKLVFDLEGEYTAFAAEVTRTGLKPPMVGYNNLYALLILLWSWGDWESEVTSDDLRQEDVLNPNDEAKSRINRALAQLVYNYDSIPVVKQVLSKCQYKFYLPGPGLFTVLPNNEQHDCTYLDSAFLPLLTRLLVLFVVYGVGDRNLLEPIIRDLYVELLQNRNRQQLEYSALWAAEGVEIFSTQRAIQALTFYFAYARGKELVGGGGGLGENIMLRNETGQRIVLSFTMDGQASGVSEVEQAGVQLAAKMEHVPAPPAAPPTVMPVTARNFKDYCEELDPNLDFGDVMDPMKLKNREDLAELLGKINSLGNDILEDLHARRITDHGAALLILNALSRLMAKPEIGKAPREAEFSFLNQLYKDLLQRSAAVGA